MGQQRYHESLRATAGSDAGSVLCVSGHSACADFDRL